MSASNSTAVQDAGMADGAAPKRNTSVLNVFLLIILVVLVAVSLWASLFAWPRMDEANLLLQSRMIAEGKLPYRDFYDFITPGSQIFGALLISIMGFSVVGIRLVILAGWVLEMVLIYRLGSTYLPKSALWALMGFLWFTFSRYPIHQHHFWSGLTALCAVYFISRHLQAISFGRPFKRHLLLSALFATLTLWITQSIGVLVFGALLLFGMLQIFLREREASQLSRQSVTWKSWWKVWFEVWGKFWLGPFVVANVVIIGVLYGLGIWDRFWQDTVVWLSQGSYAKTTTLGYFPTFHSELAETLLPLTHGVPMPALLLFLFRIPIAFHLFLIGLLPVLGILGIGYTLPNQFLYRVLRLEDEQMLLFWMAAVAMIFATFSYATSMHIVSNGSIAFLVGGIVIWRFLSKRQTWQPLLKNAVKPVLISFYVSLLIGALIGSLMQLQLGIWFPKFRGMSEALLYTQSVEEAAAYVETMNLLNGAAARGENVFIYYESPSLYMAGDFQNPSRFSLLIPVCTTPNQIREAVADLRNKQPLYVVDDQVIKWLHEDVRYSSYSREQLRFPELDRFVAENYHPFRIFGRYIIYKKNLI